MAVRVFSNSVIVLDEGALDTVLNGALTVAALFKRSGSTTDGTQFLLAFDGAVNSNQRGAISYNTASALQLTISGVSSTFGASFTIANDTWYLFVVRKASGTATPTANLFNFSTRTWAGWTNGTVSLDNDATAIVEVQMGNAPGGFPLNGKMMGAAVYNSVLSDDAVASLVYNARNWLRNTPTAMWRTNQASTGTAVTDDSGNGANQTSITGTTVDAVDAPSGFDPVTVADYPAFVNEYEADSWFTTTNPKTTSVTVNNSDLLCVATITEATVSTVDTPTGGGLTYTPRASVTTSGDFCGLFTFTAPSASGQTFTLSLSRSGTALPWGYTTARFAETGGVGASTSLNTFGTASLDITTTADNSAIVVIVGDWEDNDGSSRVWRTVNGFTPTAGNGLELVYQLGVGQYTGYVAYYPDAGAAGVKTVGLTAPAEFACSIAAVEILGASADSSITPGGIASSEAFGTAVVSAGVATIAPAGIGTGETFGTAVITTGAVTITPDGIASAEAFGTPVIAAGDVSITPTGIASGEAFGTTAIGAADTISPAGIASTEAFGAASISATSAITPAGVASAEAFGTAVVAAMDVISPASIGSGEAFGTATVGATDALIPPGIASAEAFGVATVTAGTVTVSPTGISSAEAFGTPLMGEGVVVIAPIGIPSAAAFGADVVLAGLVTVTTVGIASSSAFGVPNVGETGPAQTVIVAGIPSGEEFGLPIVWKHIVRGCDCSVRVGG